MTDNVIHGEEVDGPLCPEVVAARLRACRKARNLKLRDVAEKIGTTVQTAQRLETANMTLSIDWLLKICAALEVAPAELLQPVQASESEEAEV